MPKIPSNRKNEDYWKNRKKLEEDYIKQNLADDEKFNTELKKLFDSTLDEINKEISDEFWKLSQNQGIDINTAMDAVKDFDVEAYKNEAQKIVEIARKIYDEKGVVSYTDFKKEVNTRLKIYNATMRINRLEYLKSKIGLQGLKLGMDVIDKVGKKLSDDYIDEYKRQAGILADTLVKDPSLKQIAEDVLKDIGNADFSQRLWRDIDVLKSQLDEVLTKALITGSSDAEAARELRKRIQAIADNQRYVTERIVRTETARIQTDATLRQLKKYGYKYVKWNVEPGACRTCLNISEGDPYNTGEFGVYPINDVPFLPAHPNCRCSISAYWID